MRNTESPFKLNTSLCYGLLGLGKTGRSTIQWLHDHDVKNIVAFDSRDNPPGFVELQQDFPDIALFLAGDVAAFPVEKIDIFIASPGVDLTLEPQVSWVRDKPVWGDMELFARHLLSNELDTKVIGITGSNGKSTVTEMTTHLLESAGQSVVMAGNIGTPILEVIAKNADIPDYIVVELSSFQLDTTQELRLEAATVLNLTPDHLDRHHSLSAYGQAKKRIFAHAKKAVVNRDDIESCLLTPGGVEAVDFSLTHSSATYFYDEDCNELVRHDESLLNASKLRVQGKHNIANALAALALVEQAGIDPMLVAESLVEYEGLEHRMSLVGERSGVKWINDSKATNIGATLAAVNGYVEGVHLILGGQGKGQNFSPLVDDTLLARCKAVYLFGESSAELSALYAEKELSIGVEVFDTLDSVVKAVDSKVTSGDVVLFSPACASFDQFKNFEARGHEFTEVVKQVCLLKQTEKGV